MSEDVKNINEAIDWNMRQEQINFVEVQRLRKIRSFQGRISYEE